jgi:uncharacterized protein YlxW (UPF0749 family)
MRRSWVSQVCLSVLLLGIGILAVTQLRTQRQLHGLAYSSDEQAILLSELVEANQRLRTEIKVLATQEAAYREESQGALLEELVAELNRVRMLNGAIEASGPGIHVMIDGSLTALDLQDFVNELRNAGAEAIALDGQRLVVSSVFVVEDKGSIAVHGEPVHRPYRLSAIGDPDTMETALLRHGGLVAMLQRTYPNLTVQITQQSRLVLDIHDSPLALQYAQLTN